MKEASSALRILYVITKGTWGGAQRYVYDLALAAKAHGHDVTVACGTEGLLVARLKEADIRCISLPGVERDVALFSSTEDALHPKTAFGSIQKEWSSLVALIELFKEERPDVLHLNSSKIGGLGALAGRLAGVRRVLFTAHGWAFNERRPLWQKVLFRFLYALTIWLSSRTICVSEAIRHDMEFLPFSRFSTVRHGIDVPSFLSRQEARAALLPAHESAFWFGMVAELHPTKRVEDAIDALRELSGSHPEAILVVLGDGEQKDELLARVRYYRLTDRVHLLGFKENAARYLPAFDIFLMPSRTEALGLALLEAGHAGLPSIVSRVGGMKEIVRHKETGMLVPKENPHALARAMRIMMENPEDAKRYGKALKMRVEEKFSKERMIEETLALYR